MVTRTTAPAALAVLCCCLAACTALAGGPPAGEQAPGAAAAGAGREPLGIWAAPVRVDFYMEALCPYCANFTIEVLKPLFQNKLINYVELDVIPWGNARPGAAAGGRNECQHGETECELNRLLSCALAQHPVQDDWFPFLECVERAALDGAGTAGGVEALAHRCAVHAGMPAARLLACYNGGLGAALQRLAAQRTASLRPPHQYVPWVVVNGIPLMDDADSLAKFICVAYSGKDRPAACLQPPAQLSLMAGEHAVPLQRCWMDGARPNLPARQQLQAA